MSEKGTFEKIGQSDRRMFGPTKILVCGYAGAEQARMTEAWDQAGLGHVPVVLIPSGEIGKTLKEIAELPERSGPEAASDLPRAIIMSGLTETELRTAMKSYRALGLPGPLWAALTETSVHWTLGELLRELSAEREAFLKKQQR
ncbi:DUF3783 domain-containing protein [Desulfonema ishimotonii]|uniref:DUF3783 domain-containing protein n=1 Tax=Desulfonema ishimotonii TaxID=45657 RepID=A0A401G3K8_9BACT|nr:DUF3783 domain-containing protein [Desulfonema ishimotonii]GBC63827.1 DUF3783 domain-containing protein [Desulfonema ishimotonii]